MPSDETVKHDWPHSRTAVKKGEQLTGFTFFDRVPAETIGPLKAKVDEVMVKVPHPARRRPTSDPERRGESHGNE